ncbi:hypothetical protein [Selenomonas sp. AE3005]|uniref:hypothetical protein n=1 Tax=Selenomonas sp. AE3005 TaxID=1485543 RepID=UPI000487F578|nr:hypothetical protein [Selenomonas sp. AE3005]
MRVEGHWDTDLGKFIPKNKDEGGAAFIIFCLVAYGIYTVCLSIYLSLATAYTSVFMPDEPHMAYDTFYADGIKHLAEQHAQKIVLDNQIKSWQNIGWVNDKQATRGFQCESDDVSSEILKKVNVNPADIWYKTNQHSIVQSVICVKTTLFTNGKELKIDGSGDNLEIIQYFVVRMSLDSKRNILVEHKFSNEQIVPCYCNYDLEKLSKVVL